MKVSVVVLALCLGWQATAMAADDVKPIEQLPRDLATWSMLWMEVPKGMVQETEANGPLMGLIVGPWDGMASMAETVAEEGTRGMTHKRTITPTASATPFGQYVNGEPLSHRYDTSGLPKGPILRYEF